MSAPRFEGDPHPGERPDAGDDGPGIEEVRALAEDIRAGRSPAGRHALAYAAMLALEPVQRADVIETFRPASVEPYDEAARALRNLAHRDPAEAARLVGALNRGLDAGRDAAERLAAAWNDATPGLRKLFLRRVQGR